MLLPGNQIVKGFLRISAGGASAESRTQPGFQAFATQASECKRFVTTPRAPCRARL